MKRALALLGLVAALFLAVGCSYDVDLSVTASADIIFDNGDLIHVDPVTYGGFHHKSLSDADLENIFLDLTQHVVQDFRTAFLNVSLYDEIGGKHLRDETYSVIYNSRTGHYDFAELIDRRDAIPY